MSGRMILRSTIADWPPRSSCKCARRRCSCRSCFRQSRRHRQSASRAWLTARRGCFCRRTGRSESETALPFQCHALEPVRRAPQHGTADAEEAVAAREAGSYVPLVGEVAGVDLKPPRTGFVADHRVEQRVIRRADGVGTIPGLADIAHTAANRDALQAERGETVLRP